MRFQVMRSNAKQNSTKQLEGMGIGSGMHDEGSLPFDESSLARMCRAGFFTHPDQHRQIDRHDMP